MVQRRICNNGPHRPRGMESPHNAINRNSNMNDLPNAVVRLIIEWQGCAISLLTEGSEASNAERKRLRELAETFTTCADELQAAFSGGGWGVNEASDIGQVYSPKEFPVEMLQPTETPG